MKEGYIPKEQRKKILLLTDDIRLPSGVGNIGREIVTHTSHRYNWVNIGAAIKHPDLGKRFDLSEDTNRVNGINDASVTIYPSNGYGDPFFLRNIIRLESPDVIMMITDPRYFEWLFRMENELRKTIPLVYLNIWDNYPAPYYNEGFYESCDALLGISKQTVNINKLVLGDKANNKIIKYVPHGLSTNIFFPISDKDKNKEYQEFKKNLFQGKNYEFVLFFNSRNIRRKQIPDTLLAWKYFVDQLPKEKADKCALVLHTEKVTGEGTDLPAVINALFPEDANIIFTPGRLDLNYMNYLYNLADAQILLTSNEGWGLSLTEALLTGTPIIANVTGGMQDQMRFEDENGEWFTPSADVPSNNTGKYKTHGKWAFPVFPTNRSIVGSPQTPYIWDDRCNPEDVAEQIMNLYNMSKEERQECGLAGLEWATGEEAGFTSYHQAERVISTIDELLSTWTPREKFEFINTNEYKTPVLNHKLLY